MRDSVLVSQLLGKRKERRNGMIRFGAQFREREGGRDRYADGNLRAVTNSHGSKGGNVAGIPGRHARRARPHSPTLIIVVVKNVAGGVWFG